MEQRSPQRQSSPDFSGEVGGETDFAYTGAISPALRIAAAQVLGNRHLQERLLQRVYELMLQDLQIQQERDRGYGGRGR